MHEPDLWKYCTAEHCREMLLSFRLLEGVTPVSGLLMTN